jgi:hypothetical protein
MSNGTTKKNFKQSSGLSRQRKANQALRKLQSKVKRWNRYNTEQHLSRKWDTSGLERKAKQLESVIAKGRTV